MFSGLWRRTHHHSKDVAAFFGEGREKCGWFHLGGSSPADAIMGMEGWASLFSSPCPSVKGLARI